MRYEGITDPAQYKIAENILIPLGEYFQIQDDYFDCYVPPEKLGKIGTDILDGKNSWPINVALKHANPTQRQILQDNYGRKDKECEGKVKDVFREVGVEEKFFAYKAETREHIYRSIGAVSEGQTLKKDVFLAFADKIFGS